MNIDWAAALTHLLIAAILPIVFWLCSKLFPASPSKPIPSEAEFPNNEVIKWNFVSLPFMFFYATTGGYLLWYFLKTAYAFYRAQASDAEMFIGATDDAWFLVAIFGGIISAWPPLAFTLRLIMKDRYELYMRASSREFGGWDAERMLKGFSIFVVSAIVLGSAAIVNCKVVLYKDRLLSCGPLTCMRQAYQDIVEVGLSTHVKAPNGNILERRELYVRFKDGTLWEPYLEGGEPVHDKVARVLGEKTGLPIGTAEFPPGK